MAPNRSETLTMPTNAQPTSDVATFEEMPFKLEKRSVYARCSSVSVSAEEESVHLQDMGKDYYRSIASWNLKTTSSVTILGSFTGLEALSLENLPGVCSGLDEDPRQRKVKQRVAIEPENKNSKEAVENDDNSHSFSFCWQQKEEITSFPPDTEKRCEKKMTKELDLKDFKTEDKEKEEFKFDFLTIPYPAQESSGFPEGLLSLEPPSASSEGLEVQDGISMKEEITSDETAEVKVEEVEQLVKTESKDKIVARRQAGKRQKRNVWSITVPDLPAVQHKQVKKTRQRVKKRKPKSIRKHAPNQPCLSLDEIIESINKIKPAPAKRRRPNSNLSEPRDSGVQSEGSSSGSSDGCSSNSGSGGGGFSGGNSSGGGCGGKGNADGDGGDKKKYPQWYFPGKKQTDTPGRNKKKRSVEEEKDDGSVGKMEVDFSSTNQAGLQLFLPSKVDNAEQCHSPGEEGTRMSTATTGKSEFVFFPQDVQHASYCSSPDCHNHKCKNVKLELEHMQVHKEWQRCGRCLITRNIVKQHARFCRRPGCRVPDCESLRKSCKRNGEPVPVRQRNVSPPGPGPVPVAVPFVAPVLVPPAPAHIDGRVIFRVMF
ncbi:uncharacterized protein LOC111345934 [Stylophora pistillata]|uniref:uncharacterized protein LOC111345934 n=1 Tax=Stylophora pistillata TaxID=50429 RepID=UPI000C0539BA|nr:uncharacterized protein LOC111345934 [Stylophora pistillata]